VRAETAPAQAPSTPTIKILAEPVPAPMVPGPPDHRRRPAAPQRTAAGKTPAPKDHARGRRNRRKLQPSRSWHPGATNLDRTPPLEPTDQASPAAEPALPEKTEEVKPLEPAPAVVEVAPAPAAASGRSGPPAPSAPAASYAARPRLAQAHRGPLGG
jgi:hypothetical protein